MPRHKADKPLNRGVYTLPFLSRCGRKMLVAVDRDGCFVTRALVFDRESGPAVTQMLRSILDREDPPNRKRRRPQPGHTFTIPARNPRQAINILLRGLTEREG